MPNTNGTRLTHHYRQLLQRLRHGAWVAISELTCGERVKANAIRNGWIECRNDGDGELCRITPQGDAEMRKPTPTWW